MKPAYPARMRELTEDYTPLEARLDAAVSLKKGCYTGQEVLARQVNYDKITRRMVGLRAGCRAGDRRESAGRGSDGG